MCKGKGLGNCAIRSAGYYFEVRISPETPRAHIAGRGNEPLHGCIRIAINTTAQKEATYHALTVIIQKKAANGFRRKRTAPHIVSHAQRAVEAVVDAGVCHEGFKKKGPCAVKKRDRINPLVVLRTGPVLLLCCSA